MEVRSWRLEVRSWRLEGGDGAGRSSPPAVDDPMFGPDLQSGPNGQERDFQSRPVPNVLAVPASGITDPCSAPPGGIPGPSRAGFRGIMVLGYDHGIAREEQSSSEGPEPDGVQGCAKHL